MLTPSVFHRIARSLFARPHPIRRPTYTPQLETCDARVLPCTINWINPSSGFWDVATNWDRGEVPGTDDFACIPAGNPGTNEITYRGLPDDPEVVNRIESDRAFTITAGTLTVTDKFTLLNNRTLTIRAGTLSDTVVDQGIIRSMVQFGGTLNYVTVGTEASIALTNVTQESLRVTGGLTLNGTATLGRAGVDIYGALRFDGDQALGGAGQVVFATTRANSNLYSAVVPVAGTLTIGPDITIRGARGWVGCGTRWECNGTFALEGTIQADGGGIVTVGAPDWTSMGRLRAFPGATLHLVERLANVDRILALSGNDQGVAGTIRLLNGTISGGTVATTLGAALGGAAYPQGIAVLDHVTIEGNLALATATEEHFTIRNGLTLNGTATLGRPGNFDNYGALRFEGDQTLGGTGQVVFATTRVNGNFHSAVVPVAGTLTIGPDITIRGARGWVGPGPGNRWGGEGTFVLEGTVQADGANTTITVGAPDWTSMGRLRAFPGATLHLVERLANEKRALALSGNDLGSAGTIRLVNGTINGGTVATTLGAALGGAAYPQGIAVLDHVTIDGNLALATVTEEHFTIRNGMTLNGTATLGRPGNFDNYGALRFEGVQALDGIGQVVIATTRTNGNFHSALVPYAGTFTIGPDITIRGARGWVGPGPGNRWNSEGTFALEGTIQADGGNILTVGAPDWTSTGRLRAFPGSTLHLVERLDNVDRILAFSGNDQGVAGTIRLLNGTISGGTVTTTLGAALGGATRGQGIAVLDGVTVNGDLALTHVAEEELTARNGLTLLGTATLGRAGANYGGLRFEGTQSLSGGGTVIFAGSTVSPPRHNALAAVLGRLTISSDITVLGGNGVVGHSARWGSQPGDGFVLEGILQADGGTITLDGSDWTNAGIVRAQNRGTVIASGTSTNYSVTTLTGGTWEAYANSTLRLIGWTIVVNRANLVLDGSNSNIYLNTSTASALVSFSTNDVGGSFTVRNGRNFILTAGGFTNAGSLTVGLNSSLTTQGIFTQSSGSLSVDLSASFSAGTLFNQVGGVTQLFSGTLISPQVRIGQAATLEGWGDIFGDVENRGTINIGFVNSAGTLSIYGNFTQTATGSLTFDLGNPDLFNFDSLYVTGTATLQGRASVNLLADFVPREGDVFTILYAEGGVEGAFNPFELPDLGPDYALEPWYDGVGLSLEVVRR